MTAAALFDLDGTLVDTPAGMTTVLRAVVARAGGTAAEHQLRQTIGRPLADSLALLLDRPAGHPEVAAAVRQARELFTDTVIPRARALVLPGVPELLAELRRHRVRLAVVTSKSRPGAVELLTAAGLLDAFDTLSCHGMCERGKPHPDLALLAAAELDVPAHRCTVIGDAVDDMRMAVAAGMFPVGVTTGVASDAELAAAGARAVPGDPAALRAALLQANPTPVPQR
ncbi:MAG TPA: HAD family hydrolase [Actinophytocola sp.]|uniref:HAD family hydrolase n=1 Tax=Actinophytocola sp. TaxID=1872138 RepID=UPI002DBB5332|nr:HAD family hydrolase [Actinophytocola sp.]HEU5469361.1 HAD family hydrolase [Actinophytocola sp.]